MLLLVGLGNPGPKYKRNRHNLGFMALDEIVYRHSFGPFRARFQSLVSEGELGGEKVLALKPTTFVNESGRAVGEAVKFYKLSSESVVVMHDELDLRHTKVRVKLNGGHAGHNGLRSIDAHIGKAYWRVRMGIGHPGEKSMVHSHVLGDFSKTELAEVTQLIDATAGAASLLGLKDFNGFMTKVALVFNPLQQSDNEDAPEVSG